jgi:acyl-CoA thioesterase I
MVGFPTSTAMASLVTRWCFFLILGLTAAGPSLAQTTSPSIGNQPDKSRTTRTIRILPLGDSITQGGRSDRAEYTYRYPLFYMLKDAGYPIDFIGSLRTGLQSDAVWPDRNGVPFDLDHEGHYGWTTAQVRDKLPGWITTYPAPPDIALIHLGSNDEGAWNYDNAIAHPLKDIIGLLRQSNPRVVVLAGHLIANGRKARAIRPIVEQMAKEITTPASPVETVHHHDNWRDRPDDPATDTFDWAHPNPKGQQKMADKWFASMKPHLDRLMQER